ncbi:MAG TPA: CarD family transcriptional regulator [Anaerolineales bacterium]|nr:CarD family transcriptional regulator [Anaerolineales bacterium]
MDYHAGDAVMHWMHGLGRVIRREKRDVLGHQAWYYAVHVANMTVWVPVDDKVGQRLRRPTGKIRFKRIVSVLSRPGKPLPSDRHERKLLIAEYLQDGRLESLVRVIRGLLAYQRIRPLNDNDQAVMHRVRSALLAEWAHVLGLTPVQAELQLHGLLKTVAG